MTAVDNFKHSTHKKQIFTIKRVFVFFIVILLKLNLSGQDTLSVLFLGNSYTAYNNLPLLVSNLTNSAGKTLLVDANMPGGFTISNHLNDVTTLNKIQQGNWDYIIIQEQSQIPTIDFYRYNNMYPSLTQLKNIIDSHNPCAKIITYMTWGRRFGGMQCDLNNTYCSPNFVDFNHMQDTLTSAYLEISTQLDIQCAPVGVVWQNILNDTTLVLHSGDHSHPNIDGSYVAACAIFSSIWKQSTSGLNYTAGLPNQLAQYYQWMSDSIVFQSTNDWNLLINNPSADFTELISGNTVTFTNVSTSINSTLHYFWDFGDGITSSLQNPSHTYASSGTYTITLMASNCIFSDTISKTIQIGNISIEETPTCNFEFYPNPTKNQITIKVNNHLVGSVYTMYDITGKPVLNGQFLSENSVIELGNLARGMYLFTIEDHLKQTFKVIKE